jgi:hypothetical protein
MKKGALADCVFAPQAFRYGLDAYIHSGAGTGGENPVSGLWDRKTANLGVVSIPMSLSRERRDSVWHDRYKVRIGDYVVQRALLQFSFALTVEMKNGTSFSLRKCLLQHLFEF